MKKQTTDYLAQIGNHESEIRAFIDGVSSTIAVWESISGLIDAAIDLESIQGVKTQYSKAMEFRLKRIGYDLLQESALDLHSKGFLLPCYNLIQDQTIFSKYLLEYLTAPQSPAVTRLVKDVLSLGAVPTVDGLIRFSNNFSTTKRIDFPDSPDLVFKLIDNLIDAHWLKETESGNNAWAFEYFTINLLAMYANGRHSSKVVNYFYSHPVGHESLRSNVLLNMHNNLATKVSNIQFFVDLKNHPTADCRGIFSSWCVEEWIEKLLEDGRTEFDFAKIADVVCFDESFYTRSFIKGIDWKSLSVKEYKGLAKGWKLLKGGSHESLPEHLAKNKSIKHSVASYLKHSALLLTVGSGKVQENKENFQETYNYKRCSLDLIEQLYINEGKRITSCPIRMRGLVIQGLVKGHFTNLDDIEGYIKHTHHSIFVDALAKLVDEKIRYKYKKISQSDSMYIESQLDFYDGIVGMMLKDDPTAKAFEHIDRATYDRLIGHRQEFVDKIKNVNWKDPSIKRDILSDDLGM